MDVGSSPFNGNEAGTVERSTRSIAPRRYKGEDEMVIAEAGDTDSIAASLRVRHERS